MANKVRKISLDRDDIKKTIQDLSRMSKEIKSLPNNIENILDQAVDYCRSITPVSDKQGNHLRDNVYWEKTPTGYRIVQEGENVLYVEFGTGEKGEKNPRPNGIGYGWEYGVGKHIFTTVDGRRGWFYPTDETYTSFKFTQGQPANMQMYKTARWLEKKLKTEVKITMEKVKAFW